MTDLFMFVQITIWLIYFSLFYLLVTSFILIRNRIDLTTLRTGDKPGSVHRKISVCIPARNEENNIAILLESLFSQNYQNYDIHVLDDHSTDKTHTIANRFIKEHPEKMHLYKGLEKPAGWLGKPWACSQLAEACRGDILLFLDADTQLTPTALEQINTSFTVDSVDMLTVWPRQLLGTFWERTVIPLIYYALVTLLPSIYVYREPRWMPGFVRNRMRHLFAAACGQCIAITKSAYEIIGGHNSVKDKIVEDVELAVLVKKAGLIMRMYTGIGTISCRMYQNQKEMFEGLRKNFLEGFQNSLPLFTASALLHIIVFVLPFISLLISLFILDSTMFFLSAGSIGLILLHRLILSKWFQWDPLYAFLHPLGVLWFQWLGIVKIADYLLGRKSLWKGRKV